MSYLVDTNVLSEIRRRTPDRAVSRWFSALPTSLVHLSVLTLGEIGRGIAQIRARDPRQADSYQGWLDQVRSTYRERIVIVDERICDAWADLSARATLPVVDGLLMATAVCHGLTFVTQDVRHPLALGIPVLNPWEI